MYKTTNSGASWFQVGSTGYSIHQLEFINENTGFATYGGGAMLKTTTGGLNWIQYNMPNAFGVVLNDIKNFKIIDSNTIYGDRATRQFPNGRLKGIIWKSTNGGINWGFQQPDTNSLYQLYLGIEFADSLAGWSSNIRTTNGGGPIIINEIFPINTETPKGYTLYQNYPNPFNPQTTISFSITKKSYVNIKIYDLMGKEVIKIYANEFLEAGIYKTVLNFGNANLSSGIYFYSLYSDGERVDSKKMLMLK
ncbi:MAG: T9SS type A sorting domain-containing protein [Ignavibacteriae bacterium]|nr:T9SS type A sorting domain-containing protein [Ignavibacteriota bacterium]